MTGFGLDAIPDKIPGFKIITGDCTAVLPTMPAKSVHCVVTSPPYWGQRRYTNSQVREIGSERSPETYISAMVEVGRGVRHILRDDGTFWLNIGDKYSSDPKKGRSGAGKNADYLGGIDATAQTLAEADVGEKQLLGLPWRVALALQADGWILRSDIIWHKPNAMPSSAADRVGTTHEYIFMFTKQPAGYYFDMEAVKVPTSQTPHGGRVESERPGNKHRLSGTHHAGQSNSLGSGGPGMERNLRSVWTIPVAGLREEHFAAYPNELARLPILAGTSEAGCCPKCATPYKRQIEKERVPTRPGLVTKIEGKTAEQIGNRDPERHITTSKTIGWAAGCDCNAGPPVPCVVADPFGGASTTAVVALENARRCIEIELNPEYVELGRRRVWAAYQSLPAVKARAAFKELSESCSRSSSLSEPPF